MLDGRCAGQELRGASSSVYALWPRLPLRQNSRRAVACPTSQSVDEARITSGRLACSSVSCCCANVKAAHVITYPSERPQTEAAPADVVASQPPQASWRSPQSRPRSPALAVRQPRQRQLDIRPGQPSGIGATAESIAPRPAGLQVAAVLAGNGGSGGGSSSSSSGTGNSRSPGPGSSIQAGTGDSGSEGLYTVDQQQPVTQQHFLPQLHPASQPQLQQQQRRRQQGEHQQSVSSAAAVSKVRSTDGPWLDPPQLTRLIGACTSWRELNALVTKYAQRFNTIHVTAVATRIARLPMLGGSTVTGASCGGAGEGLLQRQQQNLRQQEQRYGAGIERTQSQELMGVPQRGAGQQVELLELAGFIRLVLALVESHATELDARGIANISWALAKALPPLPSLSPFPAPPQQSAKLQSQSSGLEHLGTAPTGPSRCPGDNGDSLGTEDCSEVDIAKAVRAAARGTVRRLLVLPAADPGRIETRTARGGSSAANAAVGGGAMAPQHVANALWAAASLGILDAADSSAAESDGDGEAEARGTRTRISSGMEGARRWVLRAISAARSALRSRGFSEEGISQLIWSVSELGLTPDAAWMQDLYCAVSRQAPELSAHSAANVLLSLARMATDAADSNVAMPAVAESDGDRDEYNAAADAADMQLGGSSGGRSGVRATLAAATFRQPTDAWLFDFLTDTAAALGSADPVSLANSAWALAVLMRTRTRTGAAAAAAAAAPQSSSLPPPSSWLQSYYAALAKPGALRRFTDAQLGLMLWSLADLSDARPGGLPWAPPPELLAGLTAELRRRLADMPDKGFAMASWGLQRLLRRQQQRQQLLQLRHLEGQLRVQEQPQWESRANQEGQQQQAQGLQWQQGQEVRGSELAHTAHMVREAGLEAAWLTSAARRMPYMADRWLLLTLQTVAGWAPAGADAAWFLAATDAVLRPPLSQHHLLSHPQRDQQQTKHVPAVESADFCFPGTAWRKRPLLPRLLQALLLAAEACLPPGRAINVVMEAAATELLAAVGQGEFAGGPSAAAGGGVHVEAQPMAVAVPWTATELLRCGAALARAGYLPEPIWRQAFFGRVLELAALSATLEVQQPHSNLQHDASQEEDGQRQRLRRRRLSASDVALLLSCSQRWAATASNTTLVALLYGVPYEVWTPRSAAWVCRLLALQASQLPQQQQQQQRQQQQRQSLQLQQERQMRAREAGDKHQRWQQQQDQDREVNAATMSRNGGNTESLRGSLQAPGSLRERDSRTDAPAEAPSPSALLPSGQYDPEQLDLDLEPAPLSTSASGSCRPVLDESTTSAPPPPVPQPSQTHGSALEARLSGSDMDMAVNYPVSDETRLRLRTPKDRSFSGLDGDSALGAEGFGFDLGSSGLGGAQDVVRVRDVVLVAPRPRPPQPKDSSTGRRGAAAAVGAAFVSAGLSRAALPVPNPNGDTATAAAAATATTTTLNGLQEIMDDAGDSSSSGDGDGILAEARLPYAPGADGSGGRREEVLQRGPGRPAEAAVQLLELSSAFASSGTSVVGGRGPMRMAAVAVAVPTNVVVPSATMAPRPAWSSAAAAAAPAAAAYTNTGSGNSSDGEAGLKTGPAALPRAGLDGLYGTGGTGRDSRGGDDSNSGIASLTGGGAGQGALTAAVPEQGTVSPSPPPSSPALRFVMQTLDTACASLERQFRHRLELQERQAGTGGGGGGGPRQSAVITTAEPPPPPPPSTAAALGGRWSLLSLSQLLWSVARLRLRLSPRQRAVLHAALTVALLRWSAQPPHALVPLLWACCRLGMPLGAGLTRLLCRALLLHPGLQPAALSDGSLLMLLEALVGWRVDPPTHWSRKVPHRLALWLWRVSPAVASATAASSTFSRRLASATAAGRGGASTARVGALEHGEGSNGSSDNSSRSGVEAKQLLLVLRALRRLQIAAHSDAGSGNGFGDGRGRTRSRAGRRLLPPPPLPSYVQFPIGTDPLLHTSVRLQLPPRWSPSWGPVVPSKITSVRSSSKGGVRHSGGGGTATALTPVDAVLWVELWPMLRTVVRQRLAEVFGLGPAGASVASGVVPPPPSTTSPRERLAALMCGAACGLVDWEAWGVPALRRLASELPPRDYHAWLALAVGLQCRVSRGSLEDLLLAWCIASGPQLDFMTPRQLHTTLRLAGRVAETLLQPLSFDWVSVALRRYSRSIAALSPAQLAQVPAVLRRLRRLPPPQWQASYADLVVRRALPHMSGARAQAMLRAAAALSPGLAAALRGPVHARMTQLWFGQQALWRWRQRQAAKRQAQHQHHLRLRRWKNGQVHQVQLKNRKRPPTARGGVAAASL